MTTAKVQVDDFGMRTKVVGRVFQALGRRGQAVELLLQSGHKVVSRKGDDNWKVVWRLMFPGKRVDFDPMSGRIQPVGREVEAVVEVSEPVSMPKREIGLNNRIEGMRRWEFDEFSRMEMAYDRRDAMDRETAFYGREERPPRKSAKRIEKARARALRLQRALKFAEIF